MFISACAVIFFFCSLLQCKADQRKNIMNSALQSDNS